MTGTGHYMRRFLRPCLWLLLCLGLAGPAWAEPAVTAIRLGLHPDMTRVVLDLSEPLPYRVYLLSDPYRVVIDLAEVEWRIATPPPGRGVVSALRYGLFTPGTSRVVLDLAQPALAAQVLLLPAGADKPVRLVVDLAETTPAAFEAARLGPPDISGPDMAAVAVSFPIPPPKPRPEAPDEPPMIVIDAGHGGIDPGALGVTGIYEKEITLLVAQTLRDLLTATGRYDVRLTRDGDNFIRLRDRIAIARAAGADLFLSLHADAHETTDLRGASVYTLSENASDEEAEALAAKENKADLIAGVDLSSESEVVTGILIDLAQRETKNHSVLFARLLIDAIGGEAHLLRNTHRFAGFAVLKAPDVPSVLVELGYLSNAEDEALLRSPEYQAKLGRAIVEAIDAYFGTRQTMLQP
jgi:N-acetylmuramoyl-L-alanine amidase